jgi:hypothetical protein
MGLDAASAKMLLDARVFAGAEFESTLTLGHQELNLLPSEAALFLGACRGRLTDHSAAAASLEWGGFADGYLRHFLKARTVRSMDYSSFEGADIVHDLNLPTPASLDEQFDAVIDGGTLEHVYNVPIAWASCMRMVKVHGRLFLFTTANNYCGHGFYQFSPELFFRLFSDANGFEIEKLRLVEYGVRGGVSLRRTCYEVTDPAGAHARAMLYTKSRVLCFVQARKVASRPTTTPLQSDYVARWSAPDARGSIEPGWWKQLRHIRAALPLRLRLLALEHYQRSYAFRFRNRRFYRRIDCLDFSKYPGL